MPENRNIVLIIVLAVIIVILAAAFIALFAYYHHIRKRDSEVDVLTGGKTKIRFFADCEKIIKKIPAEKYAVVVIDIDKFKLLNERLGYEVGDMVLTRLHSTIGDSLEEGEVFARISDDHFAILMKNAQNNELQNRLNGIFTEFERRNSLFIKYPVLFSAGVCRLGQCKGQNGAVDFTVAIDRCKLAKKSVKGYHTSEVAFYDGKIRDISMREKDIENAMPPALERKEFLCYLQPKYGTENSHIVGAEALIRWDSKEFGFLSPNEFIPVAEKNGFVVELDFFILEEVCKLMRRWIDKGITPITISVNQSRLHINDDDYIWRLREIVDKYEIPYEYIELEVTESVFNENTELMLKILHKLHELGFKLSIDDFGSGYSSLNLLKDIPADVLKIDREFFNGTVNSSRGRAVISSVVDLAKNLDMNVISEGIETGDQMDFLKEIRCGMVQGYYFAKPMTIKDFENHWENDQQNESDAIPDEMFNV